MGKGLGGGRTGGLNRERAACGQAASLPPRINRNPGRQAAANPAGSPRRLFKKAFQGGIAHVPRAGVCRQAQQGLRSDVCIRESEGQGCPQRTSGSWGMGNPDPPAKVAPATPHRPPQRTSGSWGMGNRDPPAEVASATPHRPPQRTSGSRGMGNPDPPAEVASVTLERPLALDQAPVRVMLHLFSE
jgi:hypothetical protein